MIRKQISQKCNQQKKFIILREKSMSSPSLVKIRFSAGRVLGSLSEGCSTIMNWWCLPAVLHGRADGREGPIHEQSVGRLNVAVSSVGCLFLGPRLVWFRFLRQRVHLRRFLCLSLSILAELHQELAAVDRAAVHEFHGGKSQMTISSWSPRFHQINPFNLVFL